MLNGKYVAETIKTTHAIIDHHRNKEFSFLILTMPPHKGLGSPTNWQLICPNLTLEFWWFLSTWWKLLNNKYQIETWLHNVMKQNSCSTAQTGACYTDKIYLFGLQLFTLLRPCVMQLCPLKKNSTKQISEDVCIDTINGMQNDNLICSMLLLYKSNNSSALTHP